jgi:site-specific DNA-cytosine methylase
VDLLEKEYGDSDDPPPRLDVLRLAVDSGEWTAPKGKVGKIHPLGIIYGDTPSLLPRQQDKLYSNMGISPTIATFSTPCFESPQGWRILTPRECMRLQGFPDSFLLHKDDTMAYKQAGNAVTVRAAAAVIGRLFDIVNGQGPVQEEETPRIEWGE